MKQIMFDPKILEEFFSDKVCEYCKSCKRYGSKAQCPPHIENVSYYKKVLPKFEHGALVFKKFLIENPENWKELGISSSKEIQDKLFNIRAKLLSDGHFAVVFGAGSCKNCEKCSFPCRFPDKAIIPIEGTGLNVVAAVKKITKLNLKFPVKDYFYRIGVVLFDD
jgi:predicted metal-binding protein